MSLLLGNKPVTAEKKSSPYISDVTTASFERDVIVASADVPVVVDFWAPWCGPCKQLGPLLEKAVAGQGGKIRMTKVNIDQSPEIAQALRIQSIPTVYAFYKGQPVDGFMGAVPESQIRQFIDKLLATAGMTGGNPAEILLEEAQAALESGDTVLAEEIFGELLTVDGANPQVRAGLAKLMLDAGRLKDAKKLLAEATPDAARHIEMVAVRAALDLAEQTASLAEAGASRELEARLAKQPEDLQIRFDLAMAYYAEGNRESAVDTLLDCVRRDRTWKDEQARKQLVKLFEAFGPTDPLTVSARKRLSSILFA